MAWEAIIELSGGWRPDFSKILTSKKGGEGGVGYGYVLFPKKKKTTVPTPMAPKLNMTIYDLKLKSLHQHDQ